jgi:hypothetical protein
MSSPAEPALLFRVAADLVVALHAAFVAFVVLGGLLVIRWRRLAWLHLPAAAWGVLVELRGWICPLTPLEQYFRERSGSGVYQGDFIEHYLLPLLYPTHLTRGLQIRLGVAVVLINLFLYLWIFAGASRVGTPGARPRGG